MKVSTTVGIVSSNSGSSNISNNTGINTEKKEELECYFIIPFLIEIDRPTNLIITATSVLSNHVVKHTVTNVKPMIPLVIEIGPLEVNNRYNVYIEGIKKSPRSSFVINTPLDNEEVNLIVINCMTLDGIPSGSQLLQDVTSRTKVPFSGINTIIHTNFQPNLNMIIDEYRNNYNLAFKLQQAKKSKILSQELRFEFESLIEVLRSAYRTVFSRPAYEELLNNSYNLFMPSYSKGFQDKEIKDIYSGLDQVIKLIHLIITRLNQEYFLKLLYPKQNVFRYRFLKPIGKMRGFEEYIQIAEGSEEAEDNDYDEDDLQDYEYSSDLNIIDCLFEHWLKGYQPAINKWETWFSPNRRVCIEQMKSMYEYNKSEILEQIKSSPIDIGTRIIIIHEDSSHINAADSLIEGIIPFSYEFQQSLLQWKTELIVKMKEKPSAEEQLKNKIQRKKENDLKNKKNKKTKKFKAPQIKKTKEKVTDVKKEIPKAIDDVITVTTTTKEDKESAISGNAEGKVGDVTIISNDNNKESEKKVDDDDDDDGDDDNDDDDDLSEVEPDIEVRTIVERKDRQICLICPSTKYGTRNMALSLPFVEQTLPFSYEMQVYPPVEQVRPSGLDQIAAVHNIYFVDSIYRSNQFERLQKQSDKDKEITSNRKKVSAAAAKTKRAQRQKEEEDRQRQEQIAKEIADMKANQVPDGFITVSCKTSIVQTNDFSYQITLPVKVRILGDFIGSNEEKEAIYADVMNGLPTAYDFLQLPDWLVKMSPAMSNGAIFVQDEVLLVMRQFPIVKDIVYRIETADNLIDDIKASYDRSRLSELSRPEDLREVDMSINGIVPMFFRDLIKQIWENIIPIDLKDFMMPLKDEFVMSYCFSRALKDMSLLTSSTSFAESYQYAMLLSLQLKLAQQMTSIDRYKYLIQRDDDVTIRIKALQLKEQIENDKKFRLDCESKAFEFALRFADPKVADERDRIRKEEEEKIAAWDLAKSQMKKGIMEEEAEERALEAARLKASEDLKVADINYDSDLEALNKEEKKDDQSDANSVEKSMELEQNNQMNELIQKYSNELKQKNGGGGGGGENKSNKVTNQAKKRTSAVAVVEQDENATAETLDALNKERADLLKSVMEVAVNVIVDKEYSTHISQLAKQLIDEKTKELMQFNKDISDEEKYNYAVLQLQRILNEKIQMRRFYGDRLSFMMT